jgi:hypothetical protein
MENAPRVVVMAAAIAAGLWPLSAGGAESVGGVTRSVANHLFARSPLSSGHLYVLDVARKAVYRFPLAQDGLPAVQPDGVLYPQSAKYPQGLAVDKFGHAFVADPDLGTVAEFASGATGQQKPISILDLSAYLPDRLNFDHVGRLYVHYNAGQKIAIFAQGAHGHDAPISVVPPYYHPENAGDYVAANDGMLYVLDSPGPVMVYEDPLQSPSQPNRLMWTDGGFEFDFEQSLALDVATDKLYIQFAVRDSRYWNKVNYGVRPRLGASVAVDPLIFTGDCGAAGQSSIGGTVIVKKYLIVSCNDNSDVLVYRTDQFGRQRAPVETVGQGSLVSPWQIAVGP